MIMAIWPRLRHQSHDLCLARARDGGHVSRGAAVIAVYVASCANDHYVAAGANGHQRLERGGSAPGGLLDDQASVAAASGFAMPSPGAISPWSSPPHLDGRGRPAW